MFEYFSKVYRENSSFHYNVTTIMNGYFTLKPIYIYDHTRSPLIMRNVLDKSCGENQNSRFMCNSFTSKIVPLWDNVDKYGRARRGHMTLWYALCTPANQRYGYKLRICNTAFPWQQWLRERASLLGLYVQCLSCLIVLFSMHAAFFLTDGVEEELWTQRWDACHC